MPDWAWNIGVPFALVLGALGYFFREAVVPASRLASEKAAHAEELQNLKEVHAREIAELKDAHRKELLAIKDGFERVIVEIRAQLATMAKDRDFYKEFTFAQAKALFRATGVAEKAFSVLPGAGASGGETG